jgi:aryl-alcohol dehydrogenase-like predicted oxidoreductase
MKYRLLGRSGLRVSELCLGCGTLGTNWGDLGAPQDESMRILDGFANAGGNYLDTSNRYQESQSEQWVGDFIQKDRDYFVVGTKYSLGDGAADFNGVGKSTNHRDPNNRGNHRKNLRRSVEASLKRLKTDFIDILWLHIWDYSTPYDEIVLSINDLIKEGKILYAGLSSVPAWQVARMNSYADHHGLHPFIALQNEWSLVERSHEPEYLPMCKELDLGMTCWSPLHGGLLTGKYSDGSMNQSIPNRMLPHVTDPSQFWYKATQRNLAILKDLQPIVEEVGEPWSAFALRWLMQRHETVAIPIYSGRTEAHSKESLRATEFELSEDQMKRINEITTPAISSPYPAFGPYPYTMLEYGSPALPNFYSRALLHGETESMIKNHRVPNPYTFHPSTDA